MFCTKFIPFYSILPKKLAKILFFLQLCKSLFPKILFFSENMQFICIYRKKVVFLHAF